MKTAIFDGTAEGDAAAAAVNAALLRAIEAKRWSAQTLVLRDMRIPMCVGCFECWIHTPGVCIAKGDCDLVARAFIESDLVVLLTRVTFGGYSSQLKKGLDHCIGLISPFFTSINGETHHKKRYARYPSLFAVGLQERVNDEQRAIFETLLERNAINTHAPAHGALVLCGVPDATVLDGQVERALTALA